MSISAYLKFPMHGETEALHKDMWQQWQSPALEPMQGSFQPWSTGNVMDRPPSIARLAVGTDRSIGRDGSLFYWSPQPLFLALVIEKESWTMGVSFILRQNKTSSINPRPPSARFMF